ncbi:Helix-turn-helix domain-containing protein [Arboricoccus pini]|uniref:Helix-turn-helix domain-containing protein n=1 Tax=Arboricoccus pini TaxID=1963835 RepID=A0A212RXF6_9PROT|nr:helix-turn-helix transcriptional regulator [Arboricoccus pini]SNB77469.1 Helix-turn-helix domain-containing protein [Arboricoccus pini]
MIELGDFVRRRRHALPPLIGQGTRPSRTPGWRREEVAQAAGLSVTWYTWIEQGREIGVSPAALDRLARVLRLAPAERAYLFELAGLHDPAPPTADHADEAALRACLAALTAPAYLLDQSWDALLWNAPAADLMAPWLGRGDRPNLLRFVFLDPAARDLILPWESRAFRLVAEFRKEAGGLGAPARTALVEELSGKSPVFKAAWQAHQVTARTGGQRSFRHPERGLVHYQQTSFDLADRMGLKLHVLTPLPPGAAEAT